MTPSKIAGLNFGNSKPRAAYGIYPQKPVESSSKVAGRISHPAKVVFQACALASCSYEGAGSLLTTEFCRHPKQTFCGQQQGLLNRNLVSQRSPKAAVYTEPSQLCIHSRTCKTSETCQRKPVVFTSGCVRCTGSSQTAFSELLTTTEQLLLIKACPIFQTFQELLRYVLSGERPESRQVHYRSRAIPVKHYALDISTTKNIDQF